ncbi:Fic family protein [Ferruginibacter sp. SUN106]|uniref:Fic family protein n=1 Tax=Ferruginibacter sp. SUN106 TaxID=2978348 RepID=UPI003D35B372
MNEQTIISLIEKFQSLNLSAIIDFDKFNGYAITHHSTTIEGSTLTEIETRLLLDEGITPAGKPLLHSLMVQDHYNALLLVTQKAKEKIAVTPQFIQQINATVMKQTGSIYQTVFGELNATKGVFRKGNVSAGSTYFVGYEKVEPLVKKLCTGINEKISTSNSVIEKLNVCFDAHFDLVTIHPFYDGNGRTSRLLMNYLQLFFDLPLSIVFKEDKAAYFEALQQTRKEENITLFQNFMYTQYARYLQQEIDKFEQSQKSGTKGKGFSFVF